MVGYPAPSNGTLPTCPIAVGSSTICSALTLSRPISPADTHGAIAARISFGCRVPAVTKVLFMRGSGRSRYDSRRALPVGAVPARSAVARSSKRPTMRPASISTVRDAGHPSSLKRRDPASPSSVGSSTGHVRRPRGTGSRSPPGPG